jgi:hypothetical protein
MYHNTLARAAKHDALRHIIALDLLEFDEGTLPPCIRAAR